MKLRVAQKILKNADGLKYNAQQVRKAQSVANKYQKNAPTESAE